MSAKSSFFRVSLWKRSSLRGASGLNIRHSSAGNIFALLFGAVALTGVLGVVGMQIVVGPVSTITRATQKNMIDTHLMTNARLLVVEAATHADNRDSDSDGYIEPIEYIRSGTGGCSIALIGGGCLPSTLGASLTDPYGTPYGYCVWDHGSVDNGHTDAAVAAPYRLRGVDDPTKPVIAILSAGADKVFQTGCYAYDGVGQEGVIKPVSSDDYVFSYSYAEAGSTSGGLWTLKSGAPDVAEIAKNLEIKDSGGTVKASVDSTLGIGDFLGITTDLITAKTGGMITLDGKLGVGDTLSDPAYVLDVHTTSGAVNQRIGTDANSNAILIFSTGLAGSPKYGQMGYDFTKGVVKIVNDSAFNSSVNGIMINPDGNLGIGVDAPTSKLHVKGTARAETIWFRGNPSGAAASSPYSLADLYAITDAEDMVIGIVNEPTLSNNEIILMNADHNESAPDDGVSIVNYGTGGYSVPLRVTGEGRVGIGTTAPTSRLDVQETNTNTAGTHYMHRNLLTVDPPADGTGAFYASLNNAATLATNPYNLSSLHAGYNLAAHFGTGTVGNVIGARNYGYNYSASGTVTSMFGAYNHARNSSAGTATNIYGSYNYGLNHTGGTSSIIHGAYNYAFNNSANTTPHARGSYNYVRNAGGGSITNAYAVQALMANANNSAITNAYSFYANLANQAGSTVQNYYGFYATDEEATAVNSYAFYANGTARSYFGGNVGVGVTNPSYRIDLPNTASAAGQGRANAWVTYSDGRFKTDVKPIKGALEKVNALNGVTYRSTTKTDMGDKVGDKVGDKAAAKEEIGLIAQDVFAVLPQVVSIGAAQVETNDGNKVDVTDYHAVDYARITALLIEAVKELTVMNGEMRTEIAVLKDALNNTEVKNLRQTGVQ